MATTYILKRKLFNAALSAVKAFGGGSTAFGVLSAGGMVASGVGNKKTLKQNEADFQQNMAQQKDTLSQLENIAKS